MSSTYPPDGPNEGQHDGAQPPEYLEQGGGEPLAPEPATSGSGRRTAIIGGGVVAALGLAGGAIWAATAFFGSGPQPAEALPADTLGYVSIDLDPSGSQKVEAVKMLKKFPAFDKEINLDTDDDIRKKIFDEIQGQSECENLDYGDDIEPWLGDRFAVAAVDTGENMPSPVVVVQVKDQDGAEDGLNMIRNCATSGDADDDSGAGDEAEGDLGGWSISGDWAVIAETEKIAKQVTDDAADGNLADDEDYQKWTDEVGDAGIINMYAGPEAGTFLATAFDDMMGLGMMAEDSAVAVPGEEEFPTDEVPTPELPDELRETLENFQGAAATIRFDDGALEFELAGDPGLTTQDSIYESDAGDDVVSTLPEDTAAAFGVGFAEGWFTEFLDQMAAYSGGQMTVEEMISEMEAQTGLTPEDVETLLGDSAALSMSADFDPEAVFNSESGMTELPIGLKVKGDPKAIEAVLEKIRSSGSIPSDELVVLDSDSEGDMIVVGPNADYRSEILGDGDLGDSDTFQNVVREAEDATTVLFVNFDAGDDWLVKLADGDGEAEENLKPLEGLGASAWQEDDAGHMVLRLTTN